MGAVLMAAALDARPAWADAVKPVPCDVPAIPMVPGPAASPSPPPSDAPSSSAPAPDVPTAIATEPTTTRPALTLRVGFLQRASLGPPLPVLQGGWLLDTPVREGLRARTRGGRRLAATASDTIVWSLILTPFANGAYQVFAHGGDIVTVTEVEMVAVEGIAISMVTAWLFHVFMGRERPFATADGLAAHCKNPDSWRQGICHSDRNASFFSGHSASSFTSAGMVCAQTLYLADPRAYGNFALCGGAMATAATTAMLRVIADKHYATDILAGMILGLSSGFAIPMLLHYSPNAPFAVARSLPTTQLPHDYGLTAVSALVGVFAGGIVPILSTAFRDDGQAATATGSPSTSLASIARSLSVVPYIAPSDAVVGIAVGGAL